MKLSEIPKDELELMGYDDIAYVILKEDNKKMKINDLFKKICDSLGLTNQEFEDRIADFFEILTTDRRFILVENGYWDLKEKHASKVIIDDDDEEIFIEDAEEETSSDDTEIFYDEEEDDSDDDLKDLVVIDEDEENETI